MIGNQKYCFNYDGTHHLSLCPKDQDSACKKKNQDAHVAAYCLALSPMDPKWRAAEPSENDKYNIDGIPCTSNTVTN